MWVKVVQTIRAPSTAPRVVGQPGALVWDGRVFQTPAQLKAYLGPKAYARWSVRHPTAFGAPARATPKKTAPSKVTTRTTTVKPKPATQVEASPTVSTSKSRPLLTSALMILVLLGGLVLGAIAVLPTRMVPVAVQRLYIEDPDRRMIAFAAATAILLGFGVSLYLS